MADAQLLNFSVGAEEGSLDRLDRFLVAQIPGVSRSELKRRLRLITVNGKEAKLSQELAPGDQVQVTLAPAAETAERAAVGAPEVLHEEEHFLIVSKPAGLLVHGVPGLREPTMAALLAPWLHGEPSYFADPLRRGIVHRLDRETSGVMVFARTPHGEKKFLKLFHDRRIEKTYLALVKGVLWQAEGVYDKPMGPDPGRALRHSVKPDGELEDARDAVTHWVVEERYAAHCLMRIGLETGRTHQIRVHFTDAGHPVVGDRKYDRNAGGEEHLFLCATALAFEHPDTHEPMRFEIPLPPWFEARLETLRAVSGK